MNALSKRSLRIAELNDALRKQCTSSSALQHGRILITRGVHALGPDRVQEVLQAVADFDAFNKDNDPYHEHDFGSLAVCGEMIFWKIDAYQRGSNYLAGAETPEDAATTDRVLTIMLAEEY